MDAGTLVMLVAGLVALVVGGEILVRGGGGIAQSVGMSPLLVGLTVIAFATSAPELAVALSAAGAGNPGLAVGNVIGSNIANVLLVLGASAVILPMAVGAGVLRRDIPVVAVVSALALGLSLDLRLSRADGLVLVAALLLYLAVTVVDARRESSPVGGPGTGVPHPPDPSGPGAGPASAALGPPPDTGPPADPTIQRSRSRIGIDTLLVVIGVALLVLGANWLVEASTQVARSFGVTDLVIGLTVVAVGTSLPELATSIIAAARGQRDLAVGNIVGSCLFNLGAVLGLTAVLAPSGVPIDPSAVRFDLPFMVATAVALLPLAFTGLAIARWEGVLLVGYYVAYLAFLVLTATEHPALPAFGAAMRLFVIPLTVLTLTVLVLHELRRRRRDPAAQAPA